MGNVTPEGAAQLGSLDAQAEALDKPLSQHINELKFVEIEPAVAYRSFNAFESMIPAFVSHASYGCCVLFAWRKIDARLLDTDGVDLDTAFEYVAKKIDPALHDVSDKGFFVVHQHYIVAGYDWDMVLPLKHMIYKIENGTDITILNHDGTQTLYTLSQFMELVDKDKDGKQGWRMARSAHIQCYPQDAQVLSSIVRDMRSKPIASRYGGGAAIGDPYDGVEEEERNSVTVLMMKGRMNWYQKLVDFPERKEVALSPLKYSKDNFVGSQMMERSEHLSAAELNQLYYK
jgi:hypothetical protein